MTKERRDFDEMYRKFEYEYNPYPVYMSRADAFEHALADGLIDYKTYLEAEKYFGALWYYDD